MIKKPENEITNKKLKNFDLREHYTGKVYTQNWVDTPAGGLA